MPIPATQNCANCQFYDTITAPVEPGRGYCLYNAPGQLRFNIQGWNRVEDANWCSFWAPIGSAGGGGGTVQDYDAAAGYRGFSQTGDTLALTTTWQNLAPSFTAITGAINFDLQAPGILQLNYTTFTPNPTFQIYITAYAVCSFRTSTTSEDVELTFAINGTTDTTYTVLANLRTVGNAIPITTIAGLQLNNLDTIALQARTPSGTASVDIIAYHLLLESYRVISF